jgi:hypothetical protein
MLEPTFVVHEAVMDVFQRYDLDQSGYVAVRDLILWFSIKRDSSRPVSARPILSSILSVSSLAQIGLSPNDMASCLEHIREETQLAQYHVQDIFAFFSASAKKESNDGTLSRAQFFRCFNKLVLNKSSSVTGMYIYIDIDRSISRG